MKTFLVAIIAGLAGFFIHGQMNRPAVHAVDALPAPARPSAPPVAATKPAPELKNDPDVFNADGSLKPLPPGTKYQPIWGRVKQHLDDGRILMESNIGLIALSYPGNDGTVDGQHVPKFTGVVSGTYRYATIDGASRTVPDVLYIPAESVPIATPQPGAKTWPRSTALDPPARR